MKKLTPYFLSLFLTVCVFLIHISGSANSMLNYNSTGISNDYLTIAVDYHNSYPAFQKRPLSTFIIQKTSTVLNISIGQAFIGINFSFIFLNGLLLFYLSQCLTKKTIIPVANVLVYFLCFSNLFAFFPPIYTYDEPLQFTLIFLALIALYHEKWLLFALSFGLSLIARESGVILLPGLFLILINYKKGSGLKIFCDKKVRRKLIIVMLPLFIYLVFIEIYLIQLDLVQATKSDLSNRFLSFIFNFQTPKYALESLSSFFLVLGLHIYLIFYKMNTNQVIASKFHQYILAFILTVILNTAIVLSTTQARESRLFVLPLFFLWPIFTQLFKNDIKLLFSLKNYITMLRQWQYLILFIVLNILNYYFSFQLYATTIGKAEENYFNEYMFLLIFLLICHGLIKHHQSQRQIKQIKSL